MCIRHSIFALCFFISIAGFCQNRGVRLVDQTLHNWTDDIGSQIIIDDNVIYFISIPGGDAHAMDVSNLEEPAEIGVFQLQEEDLAYFHIEDDICIASHANGLGIYDISSLESPREISSVEHIFWFETFAVHEDILVVEEGHFLLDIVDISDLDNPEIIATINTGIEIEKIIIKDNYIYAGGEQLAIFDILQPENPSFAGGFDCVIEDLILQGNYLYTVSETEGVKVLNVSNPENVIIADSYNRDINAHRINILEDILYVSYRTILDPYEYPYPATYSALVTFDVSNPENINEINEIRIVQGTLTNFALNTNILIAVGYLHNVGEIRIYSMDDPLYPQFEHNDKPDYRTDYAQYTYIHNDLLFVNGRKMRIFNIANPPTLPKTAEFEMPYNKNFRTIDILDGILYSGLTTWHSSCVYYADISNPHEPGEVEVLQNISVFKGLRAIEDNIIVLDGENENAGISIISGPNVQRERNVHLPLDVNIRDLVYENGYAYVAAFDDGVIVIDCRDLDNPLEICQLEFPGIVRWIEAGNGHLFVSDGNLHILSLDDPLTPEEVSVYETELFITKIRISENHLFLSLHNFGNADCRNALHIIDISDIYNPRLIGVYQTQNSIYNFAVSSPYVFSVEFNVEINRLFKFLSIYDCSESLEIIKEQPSYSPGKFKLLPVCPNPFNSRLILDYEIPFMTRCAIDIYDLNGRFVESILRSRLLAPGVYRRVWNPSALCAGTYMIVFRSGSQSISQSVVFLP